MITASIRFSSEFVTEAMKRHRRQHRGKYVDIAIKVVAITLVVPIAIWMFWNGHFVIAMVLSAASVFMFFAQHVGYWFARRSFKKSPYRDEDVTIEFTEVGFHARSPKQDVKLQWPVFTKIVQFRDGFLLYQGPGVYNWIPLSSLGDASQARELGALLCSKIAEQKIVEQIACAMNS